MEKIAENTWKVGTCTLKKVRSTWYVTDAQGGVAGFTSKKVALHACESRNASMEEK